jgi:hypothetical protein
VSEPSGGAWRSENHRGCCASDGAAGPRGTDNVNVIIMESETRDCSFHIIAGTDERFRLIIIHLHGLAPAGCLAAPDNSQNHG